MVLAQERLSPVISRIEPKTKRLKLRFIIRRKAVADPRFCAGGTNPRHGANLLFVIFFRKLHGTEKNWTQGRTRVESCMETFS